MDAIHTTKTGAAGALPSRRERRRAETRERLYEAAMRLLSELPFDAVTVEMITDAADVGKGTFFNYFLNKEAVVSYRYELQFQQLAELLRSASTANDAGEGSYRAEEAQDMSVIQESVQEAQERYQAAPLNEIARAARAGGSIWQQLVEMTHLIAERDAQSKRLARNLQALPLVNEATRAASQNVRRRVCDILEALIRQGQASGELRADVSPSTLADHLIGLYTNTLLRWAQSDSDRALHEAIDETYHLAWGGLYGEQKTSQLPS